MLFPSFSTKLHPMKSFALELKPFFMWKILSVLESQISHGWDFQLVCTCENKG